VGSGCGEREGIGELGVLADPAEQSVGAELGGVSGCGRSKQRGESGSRRHPLKSSDDPHKYWKRRRWEERRGD